MLVNAGFNRYVTVPVGNKGRTRRKAEWKDVGKIDVGEVDWDKDYEKIKRIVKEHTPEGEGWSLQGFAPHQED